MQNFIPEKPISKLPLLNFPNKKKNSNEQFNIFNAKMTPGDNLKP